MNDREKLVSILKVPIYPLESADPAEVVADYLLDNDVKPVVHAHWIYHIWRHNNNRRVTGRIADQPDNMPLGYEHRTETIIEHEEWEEDVFRCSNCFTNTGTYSNFCPNCGAKMDEEFSDD